MTSFFYTIFKDLTILELSSVLAGPLCGSFFAELGARVIKIENKNSGGDITRQWKIDGESVEKPSAYYQAANFRKEVLFLDFNDNSDIKLLNKLIQSADIVLSNFQKRVAQKYKLEYDDVKKIKCDTIFIQLNAFDYDDPRPGFDLVMQAETGFISMCGTDQDHLAKVPVAFIDVIAAHQMKEASLIALLHKYKSGEGSCYHISLYQSGISALVNQGTNFLVNGKIASPMATMHPNIAPYGDIYNTQDGVGFMLAIGSDQQFEKLVKTLNFLEPIPVYLCNNESRLRHRSLLNEYLQSKISEYPSKTIFELLNANNLPFGQICDLAHVFDNDLAKSMVLTDSKGDLPDLLSISNIAFTKV